VVTLTYIGSQRAVPNYNVMGVAKAALEASVRYLAADLGPNGVRVNAISAGPIKTLSASGVSNFSSMLKHAEARSPLRRNVDTDDIGHHPLPDERPGARDHRRDRTRRRRLLDHGRLTEAAAG
jgi:enoyl-[acyl-carrier protein] reductase I